MNLGIKDYLIIGLSVTLFVLLSVLIYLVFGKGQALQGVIATVEGDLQTGLPYVLASQTPNLREPDVFDPTATYDQQIRQIIGHHAEVDSDGLITFPPYRQPPGSMNEALKMVHPLSGIPDMPIRVRDRKTIKKNRR
ncbi:hypothetical protein EPVG_00336 [Emiliania huxleyi virus 201]|nr:hypothetical protein ELVG_00319 [Emiliania huxleyi virus 203]AEP15759.1 hypothetical protein EQVG_00350 [Emiliania huxleyi virus 207]AET98223.1 hypothetical protein EPVG_00336 [Emiliania huxleyi virus 201]